MPKLPNSQTLELDGPAGKLEALLEAPQETDPVACAVICHPHPLHGGTMQNKVVHTLARGFIRQGFVALRFNFRGVNESEGSFDEGRGELEDTFVAIDHLSNKMPNLPLWIAGFSVGAAIAVHAAAARNPAGLISVAPAASRFAKTLSSQPECPWLILQGDRDELVDVEETIAWVNELDPGPELLILEDAEHFFHGKLVLLRDAVEAFIATHAPTMRQR